MSRKAIQSINWAGLAERLPESQKNVFASFKAKSDQYLRRMAANPETAPKIDWSYYKKHVTTPGLVDKFQKEYEAISIPYPADKYTAQIDAEEKETLQKIQQFVQEVDQSITESQREIERIKNLLPFDQMTMEDFSELYPDVAFNPEKPTAWPNDPDCQPGADADKGDDHH